MVDWDEGLMPSKDERIEHYRRRAERLDNEGLLNEYSRSIMGNPHSGKILQGVLRKEILDRLHVAAVQAISMDSMGELIERHNA